MFILFIYFLEETGLQAFLHSPSIFAVREHSVQSHMKWAVFKVMKWGSNQWEPMTQVKMAMLYIFHSSHAPFQVCLSVYGIHSLDPRYLFWSFPAPKRQWEPLEAPPPVSAPPTTFPQIDLLDVVVNDLRLDLRCIAQCTGIDHSMASCVHGPYGCGNSLIKRWDGQGPFPCSGLSQRETGVW